MKSNDIPLRGAASVDNAKNDAAYSMSEIPNRAIIIIKESSKKKSVLSNFFVFLQGWRVIYRKHLAVAPLYR